MQTLYSLNSVLKSLRSGELLVYPTESVYGIGCLTLHPLALKQLRKLKARPLGQAWILVGSQLEQFKPYVEEKLLEEHRKTLLETRSLHRPITWIVPAAQSLDPELQDARGGIALRLSLFPPLVELCDRLSMPILSTSANFKGERPCQDRESVQRFLKPFPEIAFWNRPLGPAKKASMIKNLLSGERLR